ncbi:MAG TPA: molybdate ABC transporter substrate-binding protein [Leptolyngbyaceae cyanobacterium]
MKKRYFLGLLGGLIGAIALTSCLKLFSPATVVTQTPLLVSTAASLQDALEQIKPLFEQANSDIAVNFNFGSSGALQQQIEQGAPTDVFISAAASQMNALAKKDLLLPETRQNLLGNQLVLIVPKDSTLKLTEFQQLTDDRVRRVSVGEFRSVPAGAYAEQVFTNLNILDKLQPKFVFANNVRGVLSAVESGNVDAGVVYRTDARLSDKVTQVAIAPEDLHNPIVYPVAVLKTSRNPNAAKAFVNFLDGPTASNVFKDYGFTIVD